VECSLAGRPLRLLRSAARWLPLILLALAAASPDESYHRSEDNNE